MFTRRGIALIVAAVVIGASTTLVVLQSGVLIEPRLQYHVEMRYEAGDELNRLCSIRLFNMHDTNVTVFSVDDPLLLYSLDIDLYEPGRIGHDFILETSQTNLHLNYYEGYSLRDPQILYRMKSVRVILGSATNYTVFVTGGYLNSSISLGDGTAVNLLNRIGYWANGTLKFHLGHNITYYNTSDYQKFYIKINDNHDSFHSFYDLESAQITIDLPRPWECSIDGGWHEWTTTENIGWIPNDPHGSVWSIATPGYDNGSSRIDFELYTRRVTASLFYWNHSG
ncbi:MAG: hypothetical protein RTV41_00205 [Candidatus Thorarchaeota archaeon]